MATTQKQIEKLTKDYTVALTALIREEVVEETKERMVKFFMNGEAPSNVRRKKAAKKATQTKSRTNGKTKVGAKRSPKALEQLQDRVLKAIQDNPGIFSEELGPKLKVKGSRVLSLPLKKLREAKKIRKTGNRRETRYYPQTKARRK